MNNESTDQRDEDRVFLTLTDENFDVEHPINLSECKDPIGFTEIIFGASEKDWFSNQIIGDLARQLKQIREIQRYVRKVIALSAPLGLSGSNIKTILDSCLRERVRFEMAP